METNAPSKVKEFNDCASLYEIYEKEKYKICYHYKKIYIII